MLRRSAGLRGGVLAILVVVSYAVVGTEGLSAEIAPEYYAEMQEDAPEYVVIEPTDVRTGIALFGRSKPVTVTARVVAVYRTVTGITVGDTITIRYEHFNPRRGWVGPRPIPILRTETRYPAFLSWDGTDATFRPAAMGASFEPPITE